MSNKLLFRLAVLVAAMMCALGAFAGVDNIITNKVTKESAKDLMAKARVKKDPDNMVKRGQVATSLKHGCHLTHF